MKVVKWLFLVCAILAFPASGFAQTGAVLNGTVTDSTGGVLPGVTVTATNEATGNTFMGVTDEGGRYRIAVAPGGYKIAAELAGFATVTRTGVQLLLGQTVTISIPMAPSGVAETVTVTGETPLISTTTSTLGGNVDPKQVAELPVAGRNFMALALLAPGSRTQTMNATQPLVDRGRADDVREFQINLDGQQVTREMGTGTQPKYSQDMISEFQYIANRFDATMGRASGVLINIITKSGTNQVSGVFRLNYRSSKFSSEEPVLKQVIPIDNMQTSVAMGGPIIKDKLHYFGNFEYEREPTSSTWNTVYPAFNITLNGLADVKKGSIRGDYQLSPTMRLMARYGMTSLNSPFGPGTTNHPSSTNKNHEYNHEAYVKFTQVLSNRAVNEIEGGQAVYGLVQSGLTNWSKHPQAARLGITNGSPRIRFQNINFLPNQNLPRNQDQWVWSIKDSFTFSFDAKGRHDVRMGGEYLQRSQIQNNMRNGSGEIDARGAATPANIESLFPDPFNVDTWRLDILCATPGLCRTDIIGTGDFANWVHSKKIGTWYQDDWRISDKLTLNLGVRWDVDIGAFAEINFPPWEYENKGEYNQWTSFQPRIGFAYSLGDRTVMRGGFGLYYQGASSGDETNAKGNAQIALLTYRNVAPGRGDFAGNPTNGAPLPTFDQAQSQYCHVTGGAPLGPGQPCIQLAALELQMDPKYEKPARNWQASLGFQHQVNDTLGFEVDYIFNKGSHEKGILDNINLTYNQATGANYPFSNQATRVEPQWGAVSASVHLSHSQGQELRMSFQKRFAHRWQASGTYSLRYFWDAEPAPFSGTDPLPFAVAKDLGGEWGLADGDQRHRGTLSGIWEVGKGFQISGLLYMGSGVRQATTWGTDVRDIQGNGGTQRLRPNGTIIDRNSLLAPWNNRIDLRIQQRIPLKGRMSIDAIAEIFNLANQPNWNVGTQENQATQYNKPTSGEYRTAQVGFRFTF